MSIGFGEILMILCVAFFVVGPKDLPKVARAMAKLIKKMRTLMKDVTKEFEDEIELEETGKDLKKMKEEINTVQEQVGKGLNSLNS